MQTVEQRRLELAVVIQRADNQHIPDGYADGATGKPALDHPEISDWSVFVADQVLALPPSGIAEMVREMCVELIESRIGRAESARGGMGQMFAETQDQEARQIIAAIRSLDLSNKGVG